MVRRNTESKKLILDEFESNHLLSATDLIEKLPEIDKATIYRNLKKFVKDGILKEVQVSKDKTHYELVHEEDHQHFICDDCGSIDAIHIESKSLTKYAPKGAEIAEIQLNLHGRCSDCL